MPSWSVVAQYRNGGATYTLASTDRVWLSAGVNPTDQVLVGQFQDYTHITDSADTHAASCSNANGHVNNTKYVDGTHVSINGGGTTVIGAAPNNSQAPLKITFTPDGGVSVITSGAKFYAYAGGSDDSIPWDLGGGLFYAGEAGVTTQWAGANGLDNALSLLNHSAATSHNFYVYFSATPGNAGTKTGKTKLTLSYV